MRQVIRWLCVIALVAAPLVVPGAQPRAGATPSAPSASSAPVAREPVMLVVDTSGSMADDDGTGTAKIDGARTALLDLLSALPVDSDLGLRSYPSTSGASCSTGTLDIPPGPRSPASMAADIRSLTANGDTPTAEALQAAADDVKAAGYQSATLVLVSDGESTCADPCPVAAKLAASGMPVTVNTVGFQIDSGGADELRCIANATGGTYTDAKDSSSLENVLSKLNAAMLTVNVPDRIDYNPGISASVGVTATVQNVSVVDAKDLHASVVFDPAASSGSPTVVRPIRVLGNLAAGKSLQITWDAYAAGARSGEMDYTVTVTRTGGPPVSASGHVRVDEKLDLTQAGPLFRNKRHVVVLGDSYSSGEGAGVGQKGHTYSAGRCHRSTYTYAAQLFSTAPGVKVDNLACSGAVIGDYWNRQRGVDVASQHDQVLGHKGDLVFLTMGGNDMNFEEVITNCLFATDCARTKLACALEIIKHLSFCTRTVMSAPELWQWELGNLRPRLEQFYRNVLQDTSGWGGAPIVVLPYLDVVPTSGVTTASCLRGLPFVGDLRLKALMFQSGSLRLVQWLEQQLDNTIAQAVADVRKENPRLYYAGDVVHAAEPGHTLCDSDPWINSFYANGPTTLINLEKQQELVHPNRAGYAAEAAALTRWSRTESEPATSAVTDNRPLASRVGSTIVDAAAAAGGWLVHGANSLWHGITSVHLGTPKAVPLIPGFPVRIQGGGFLPGSTVTVGLASTAQTLTLATADAHGDVDVTVPVPDDVASGDHTLFATGFTPKGGQQVVGTPVQIGRSPVAGPLTLAGGGLLVVVAGWLILRRSRRRAGGSVSPAT